MPCRDLGIVLRPAKEPVSFARRGAPFDPQADHPVQRGGGVEGQGKETLGEIAVFSHGTFSPNFPANGVDQLRVITQGVITQRVIPEPGTLFLLGSGLAVVGGSFRRRDRRSQGTC